MRSYEDRLKRESERWAAFANHPAENLTWVDSPSVLRRVNRMVSGDEKLSWFDAFRPTCLPPEKCGGCGRFDASDVSEGSLEIARKEAAHAGLAINYELADANHVELEENRYALIVISMALHHFERLGHVFLQMNRALRPDGILIFNEFVGPTRFQWTAEQLHAINELRKTLPESFRRTISGELAGDVSLDTLHDFDESDPLHVALIELLCTSEQLSIGGGALPSHFMAVATGKKV